MVVNTDLLKSNIESAKSYFKDTSCELIPNVGTHGTAEIARYQTNSNQDLPVFVDTLQQAQSFANIGFKYSENSIFSFYAYFRIMAKDVLRNHLPASSAPKNPP